MNAAEGIFGSQWDLSITFNSLLSSREETDLLKLGNPPFGPETGRRSNILP